MRIHTGSRLIKAPPHAIYRAHLDPSAVAAWRAPPGMTAQVLHFEPRAGGAFRMSLTYDDGGAAHAGKSTPDADVYEGRFADLVPDARIVEVVRFQSDDSRFAGEMTLITTLNPAPGGTEVEVRIENPPAGVDEADHQAGIAGALENLARFVEAG